MGSEAAGGFRSAAGGPCSLEVWARLAGEARAARRSRGGRGCPCPWCLACVIAAGQKGLGKWRSACRSQPQWQVAMLRDFLGQAAGLALGECLVGSGCCWLQVGGLFVRGQRRKGVMTQRVWEAAVGVCLPACLPLALRRRGWACSCLSRRGLLPVQTPSAPPSLDVLVGRGQPSGRRLWNLILHGNPACGRGDALGLV